MVKLARSCFETLFDSTFKADELRFSFKPSPLAGYSEHKVSAFRTANDYRAEALVRPLLLVAPLLRDDPRYAVNGLSVRSVFSAVIDDHLDPHSANYIDPTGQLTQVTVEAAYLALIFLEVPALWESVNQERALRWFEAQASCLVLNSNWLWFKVIIRLFLHTNGLTHSAPYGSIEDLHKLYLAEGWYADGENIDHYCSFAMQWWPIFLLRHEPAWSITFQVKRRLAAFLDSYRRFFTADGRVVPWGRSQIYRCAVVAPFAVASLVLSTDEFDMGLARQLVAGNIESFPTITESHSFPLGFVSEGDCAVDDYSCEASPLWAAKAFWCLLLPETDPFWTQPLTVNTHEGYEIGPVRSFYKHGELVVESLQTVSIGGKLDPRYFGEFKCKS